MTTLEELMASVEPGRIALAGDWEGHSWSVTSKLKRLGEAGITWVFQLGDFGIGDGLPGKRYLREVSTACRKYGITLVVTLGNHENHARLNLLWANPKRQDEAGNPLPIEIAERIWLLPRPYRFQFMGHSFVSMGGAASVNYDRLVKGHNWWPEERISPEEVEAVIAGGPADIMLTHESPQPPYAVEEVARILNTNPMGFSLDGLAASSISRDQVTRALEGVRPKLLAHGHMHTSGKKVVAWDDQQTTTVLCCEDETGKRNVKYLDMSRFAESLEEL